MMPAARHVLRFNPRSLFHGRVPGAFIDVSDRSTLFQSTALVTPIAADSDPVGFVRDKSGNGNHLLQVGVDGTRPLYKTDNRLHWLEGDGTDDYLRAAFTMTAQFTRVSAIRQITWGSADRIFSGGSATAGILFQTGTTPQIGLFDGAGAPNTTAAAVGADVVVTEVHDNTASRIAVNNGAYTTGTSGSTVGGGLTLFGSSGGANLANVRIYWVCMVQGVLPEYHIMALRRIAARKAGIAL